MTTIIPAADPAEFLALVPRLAGCRPVRSIALVPFDDVRTVGVLRVDLPTPGNDVDSIAATLVGMLCRVRDADGAALVVYTDDALAAGDSTLAHADVVHALMQKMDACGLRVVNAFCVAADGWGSYLDDEGHRHPLSDLAEDALIDLLPEEMRAPLGDQTSGAQLPGVDLAQTERTARALASLVDAVAAVSAATGSARSARVDLAALDPQALAAACALDDIPALFEDALRWEPEDLRPFDAAALIWCLQRPALRDIALVQWSTDLDTGDAALHAQLRWESGQEYPAELAQYLWGEGDRPDASRLERALEVARYAAALAPRASRPGPLAAAGWLCWALGRSTHAGWYVDRAGEIDAEHGLAAILATMLSAGHLPDWTYHRVR